MLVNKLQIHNLVWPEAKPSTWLSQYVNTEYDFFEMQSFIVF